MQKEAARAANSRAAQKRHRMRKGAARRTEAPPDKDKGPARNIARLHRNRGRPVNRKARNRNRGWLASPSSLPSSMPCRKLVPRKRRGSHQVSWGSTKRRFRRNALPLRQRRKVGATSPQRIGGEAPPCSNARKRPNAAAAQHVRQESHLQNGRRGCNGARGAAFPPIEQGFIDTSCLISKRYALNDILEAYRALGAREDGCLKVVITPWEER